MPENKEPLWHVADKKHQKNCNHFAEPLYFFSIGCDRCDASCLFFHRMQLLFFILH